MGSSTLSPSSMAALGRFTIKKSFVQVTAPFFWVTEWQEFATKKTLPSIVPISYTL